MGVSLAHAQSRYNLQAPQTETARRIYALHTEVLLICIGICVVVFAVLFYSIANTRRSHGREASNSQAIGPSSWRGRSFRSSS